jgi:hypothetical protein
MVPVVTRVESAIAALVAATLEDLVARAVAAMATSSSGPRHHRAAR